MKKLCFLIVMLIFPLAIFAENYSIVKYQYYLAVGNADNVLAGIRAYASDNGGYVKNFTGWKISIRIPEKSAAAFREYISSRGFIVDEQLYRSDAGETMVDLKSKLRVKQKLLRDLYKLFEGSKFHQSLDIEKEIGKVILDIESLKGQLAYYDDVTSLAEVNIDLRGTYSKTTGSIQPVTRWQWIRVLGVPNLLNNWYNE